MDLAELELGGKRLRPYQSKLIENVRDLIRKGKKRIIICSGTGSGKTLTSCAIIKLSAQKNSWSMFMAPRRELIRQTSEQLDECGVRYSYIAAGFEELPGSDCLLVSKDTLLSRAIRRNRIEIPKTNVLIIDECHFSMSRGYLTLMHALEKENPGLITIGLSATPGRADGKGLGDYWDAITTAATYEELREQGFLVPAKVFSFDAPNMKSVRSIDWESEAAKRMDKPKLVGDIIENWMVYGHDKQTIAFGATVAHSVHMRDEFLAHGVKAVHVDDSTPAEERDQAFADLKSGAVRVLCNCNIATYGVDVPEVSCIVLASPSRSLVQYRQRCGRALRPAPHKEYCCVLDHAGGVIMHGFPDEDIEWPLEKSRSIDKEYQKKRKEGKQKEPMVCQKCGCTFSGRPDCPNCGSRHSRKGREIAIEKGLLKEVSRTQKKLEPTSFDAKQRMWHISLATMARKGRTCGAAAAMYFSKTGERPWETEGLKNVPRFNEWRDLVADRYPQYMREKAR